MNPFSRLSPRSTQGQMIAILAVSFAALLALLAVLEVLDQEDPSEWAGNQDTVARLRRTRPAADVVGTDRIGEFLAAVSSCHEGYALTDQPFPTNRTPETERIAGRLARALALDPAELRVGRARLTRGDFSYRHCRAGEIDLPADGIVISVRLRTGKWLNAEVHPHEWHVRQDMIRWTSRSIAAFLLVGVITVFFVRRLARPLDQLTGAARRFGNGLEVAPVEEAGPPDLRRAIRSFNAMQRQVAREVERRTHTLAAISHDVRTPLTALRLKAELIGDQQTRRDLVTSIEDMERVTASALRFLRGEMRTEPMRAIDLTALVESECANFEDAGQDVTFAGAATLAYHCRPEALASAVRNLIDNAVKYGGGADVAVRSRLESIDITISDRGPGIPEADIPLALEPFERLAREGDRTGFGLGLAIARAVARSHDGELVLEANQPSGLVAAIRLPRAPT